MEFLIKGAVREYRTLVLITLDKPFRLMAVVDRRQLFMGASNSPEISPQKPVAVHLKTLKGVDTDLTMLTRQYRTSIICPR